VVGLKVEVEPVRSEAGREVNIQYNTAVEGTNYG